MKKYQNDYYIREEDKPNERQMNAENYLKEHNIEGILTEMINYLLHKKFKSPIVAMIKYLGGLLTPQELEENKLVIPDPQIDYHPIVEFPKFEKECNSLLKECLNYDIFGDVSKKISKFGINLGNIMRVNDVFPKNNIGCMLGDADSLTKFAPLYKPIICKVHNLKIDSLIDYTQNNFNLQNLVFNDIKKIDLSKIEGLNKISFSISRNLPDSPFVCFLNVENRTEKISNQLTTEIKKINSLKDLKEKRNLNQKTINDIFRDINYDMDFWNAVNPSNNLIQKQRVIFSNENNKLILLINFCDNFQIISNLNVMEYKDKSKNYKNDENNYIKEKSLNDVFIKVFNEFNNVVRNIQYYFGFEFDHKFGYLASNIALLGTGFSITSEIDLDKLCKDVESKKINEQLEKFDKYTDSYNINSDNKLVFTSSPKISQESIPQFFIEYFEKIQSLSKK